MIVLRFIYISNTVNVAFMSFYVMSQRNLAASISEYNKIPLMGILEIEFITRLKVFVA